MAVNYTTNCVEDYGYDDSYSSGTGGTEYWEEFSTYDWDGQPWFQALIVAVMPFNLRNVSIYADVPYKYRYNYATSPNGYGAVAQSDFMPVQVGLTGANIGEISNSYTFINLPTQTSQHCTGDAGGTFNEDRERVISENDQSMLMSKAAANGIQIGAEIKSGFVVKYKVSAVTHYQWAVVFHLYQHMTTFNPNPGPRNAPPTKSYVATGTSSGIQSDN